MAVFLYHFYNEEQAKELKEDNGEDPQNIHEAVRIAKNRFSASPRIRILLGRSTFSEGRRK